MLLSVCLEGGGPAKAGGGSADDTGGAAAAGGGGEEASKAGPGSDPEQEEREASAFVFVERQVDPRLRLHPMCRFCGLQSDQRTGQCRPVVWHGIDVV